MNRKQERRTWLPLRPFGRAGLVYSPIVCWHRPRGYSRDNGEPGRVDRRCGPTVLLSLFCRLHMSRPKVCMPAKSSDEPRRILPVRQGEPQSMHLGLEKPPRRGWHGWPLGFLGKDGCGTRSPVSLPPLLTDNVSSRGQSALYFVLFLYILRNNTSVRFACSELLMHYKDLRGKGRGSETVMRDACKRKASIQNPITVDTDRGTTKKK